MRRRNLLMLVCGLMMVALAVPVYAAPRHEHNFSMKFSTNKTKSSSGLSFLTNRTGFKGFQPGQPVDRVTKIAFTLQSGAKIDTSVVPACTKAKLDSTGPTACPKSKVGTGSATVSTPLPAAPLVSEKVELFAKKGGLLAYLTGLQTLTIDLTAKGNKITADVPQLCLIKGNCAAGEAVLRVLKTNIPAKKKSGHALITTPSKCPSTHKWTNTVVYTFVNGDTEKKQSTSPCK